MFCLLPMSLRLLLPIAAITADRPCRDVRPSVTTYNCLITAASDSGSYATLAEVGRWLQGAAEPDIKAACMNAYVSGLVKVRWWGRWW